jgi:hypothetical protein
MLESAEICRAKRKSGGSSRTVYKSRFMQRIRFEILLWISMPQEAYERMHDFGTLAAH